VGQARINVIKGGAEKYRTESAEKSVVNSTDSVKLRNEDALALLADAQRQLNTVQERINKAREILTTT
jgi:hypothetical protein